TVARCGGRRDSSSRRRVANAASRYRPQFLSGHPRGALLMNRYESEWATLYCGDSAEALDLIEKRSVGLIATDPPYGVKYVSGHRKEAFAPIVGDDGTLDVPALLGAYVRKVLLPKRHVYAFGFRAEQLKDACLF